MKTKYSKTNKKHKSATISFDLTDQYNESEFKSALNGNKYKSILWTLDQWLRAKYKYEDKEWGWEVREHLYELLKEYDVTIED